MKDSRRTNALLLGGLLLVAAAFAAYAAIVLRWFSAPAARSAAVPTRTKPADEEALRSARREFRERLLDPRAHMRLSEALWKAGRPVDSFYVAYSARRLFPAEAFRRAHAEIVVGTGGPAAAARERLKGVADPALTVPIHAEIAREHSDSPEGRDSLDRLSRLASASEDGPDGETARLARTALEELYREDPKSPRRLAALAGAHLERGEAEQAAALAGEALGKRPSHAGAARIMGMLALNRRDPDAALKWLTLAWDGDPDDLYSAVKLAQIYEKRRSDPEGALPFHLALYRQNPFYADEEPLEARIRSILDRRRESLLRGAPVEGLGARFQLADASLRAEACLRAAAYKDPRWIDALGELLDDDVEIVRRDADYALFQIAQKEPDAVRARREKWLSAGPLTRIRALNLFADLDGRNALPLVAEALRDPHPAVRAFAKVMVLDHYFKDQPEARSLGARYLSEERDPDALELVKRLPAGR